jgi:hypothetical protein
MQTGLLHSKFAVSDLMRAIVEYLNLAWNEFLAMRSISPAINVNVYVVAFFFLLFIILNSLTDCIEWPAASPLKSSLIS